MSSPDGAAPPIRTVAVIGAGTAGRGFAFSCANAGFRAILEDVMPSNLRQARAEYAQLACTGDGQLEFASTIESAVREADLVVDFVPDELESKLEIFCLIDRMAPPRTIVLTPSNALSITDLASCTYRGERCFAVRGAFPEVAGSTVSLLHAPQFNADSMASVVDFLRALGGNVQVQLDQDAPMLVKNQR